MITIEYIEDYPMWVQMIVWLCIGVVMVLPQYFIHRALNDIDTQARLRLRRLKDNQTEFLKVATRHSNEQKQLIDIYKWAAEEKSREYYKLLSLQEEE